MQTLGLRDLQGAYEASGVAPHVVFDTTRGTLTLQQDSGATLDLLRLRNAAGVVQHSWQATSVTLGAAVADIFATNVLGINFTPTAFPTRPILNLGLDTLRLLPSSRTFTGAVNKITLGFGAEFTLDFVNASAAAAVLINPTFTYAQDGGGFGSGLVVNHSATYQGDSGATRFIGPIFTFVHQPTFRANGAGAVVTHSQGRDFLSQPIHRISGGATSYTMTGTWTSFYGTGQVLAGATVTFRRIFYAGTTFNFAGTITDSTAFLIDNLTPETTNPAMGIENNIASPGIQYQGSTGLFGIFSATPVGQSPAYVVTNPVVRRAYDTTTVTLPQLAEVVGTVIADLQAYGWLA